MKRIIILLVVIMYIAFALVDVIVFHSVPLAVAMVIFLLIAAGILHNAGKPRRKR